MRSDARFEAETGASLFSGAELLVKGSLECPWPIVGVTGTGYGLSGKVLRAFERHGRGVSVQPASGPASLVGSMQGIAESGWVSESGESGAVLGVASRSALRSVAESLEKVRASGWRASPAWGGAVLIVVDDLGATGYLEAGRSTGVDARAVMEQLGVPLVEPSSPQRLKDAVEHAVALSRLSETPVGLFVGKGLVDGGGTVWVRPNRGTVGAKLAASRSGRGEVTVQMRVGETLGRMRERVEAEASRRGLNRIWNKPARDETAALGFIASGQGMAALTHALSELDLVGDFPLLELQLTTPVDPSLVRVMGACCQRLVVVEAGRGWLEREVHTALSGTGSLARIYGKRLPGEKPGVPRSATLHPSQLLDRLGDLLIESSPRGPALVEPKLNQLRERAERARSVKLALPRRTPTFPPGSVYRDIGSVLVDLKQDLGDAGYMAGAHNRSPIELAVYHGGDDTRDLEQPPFDGLGAKPPNAFALPPTRHEAGEGPYRVVLLSDERLRSGGRGLFADAVERGRHVTFVVHERLGGMGFPFVAKRIVRQLRGLVPIERKAGIGVHRIDPRDRPRFRRLMEQTILSGSVNAIVLDPSREDALSPEEPESEPRLSVVSRLDDRDPALAQRAGCPTLFVRRTVLGETYQTDLSVPMRDAAYRRLNLGPAFQRVSVHRGTGQRAPAAGNARALPPAEKPVHADRDRWHGVVVGVAGKGVKPMRRLLAEAGRAMGYDVEYRHPDTGALHSATAWGSVVYTQPTGDRATAQPRAEARTTAAATFGSADLVLGLDLLEAARAVDGQDGLAAADPSLTGAVVDLHSTVTMRQLLGGHGPDAGDLTLTLAARLHPDRFQTYAFAALALRVFGSTDVVPALMLGSAFQKGQLPLTRSAIEWAVRRVYETQSVRALRAFETGRAAAADPAGFDEGRRRLKPSPHRARLRLRRMLRIAEGPRSAKAYDAQVDPVLDLLIEAEVPGRVGRTFANRAADCLIWGGPEYLQQYTAAVERMLEKDVHQTKRLTAAVVQHLGRVMAIRDEFFVASVLTHPIKLAEDRLRFATQPGAGDRLVCHYEARPEFELLGRTFQVDLELKSWQLGVLSRLRPMRRVMPRWRRYDRRFRDWYLGLLDRAAVELGESRGAEAYDRWLAILSVPEEVVGYRQQRWQRIEAAMAKAERWLNTEATDFVSTVTSDSEGRAEQSAR